MVNYIVLSVRINQHHTAVSASCMVGKIYPFGSIAIGGVI